MREEIADTEGGATGGRNDPEGLFGLGRAMAAEKEAGTVRGEIGDGGLGELGGQGKGAELTGVDVDGGDLEVAVLEDGGEDACAIGGENRQALHGWGAREDAIAMG